MTINEVIKSKSIEIMTAAVIAALIVGSPASAFAQQSAAKTTTSASTLARPAAAGEEDEVTPASKPGQEGIKVHGHWIIDVKDKDGKVVEHRDFYNSLVSGSGSGLLISLLAGQSVVNTLGVYLNDNSGNSFVMYPATTSTVSSYFQQCSVGVPTCNPNLITTLTADSNGNLTGLKLSGQVTFDRQQTIYSVSTTAVNCYAQPATAAAPVYINVAPSNCANITAVGNNTNATIKSFAFTGTNLPTPLSVAAGQTVATSVTLSFS